MYAIYNFFKKRLSWRNLNPASLLSYYRYISLIVTSSFYLAGPPAAPFYLKAGTVVCLFLEAYVFIRVYKENTNIGVKRLLIFIETVGLAFILIITGGLDSPFAWYAINPILLAATILPTYYCWLMMAAFLSLAIFLQKYSFYVAQDLPLWPNRSPFFMIFFLSTFAAQIFTYVVAKLSQQAEIMKKQLEHIKALYEAIEVFSQYNNPNEVINLFASYSRKLTDAKKVIVWIETQSGLRETFKKSLYIVRGPKDVLPEENWYPYIKEIFYNRKNINNAEMDIHSLPTGKDLHIGTLVTVKVRTNSTVFGVLSAYYLKRDEDLEAIKQTLTFLADLCAGVLEKRFLESLAEEFLLMEEQERIAGEIHDNVTQNIFGLIYGLDNLIKKESLSKHISDQLRLMQKVAQESLKDLRASIYCMSSTKGGKENFIDEVKKYLSDLAQLNNVAIDFSSVGNFGLLGSVTKKSLYRIVREATGNAIRHGDCSNIRVSLTADEKELSLVITDNGNGFEPKVIERSQKQGLGFLNMKELARNVGGELVIESGLGEGTVVSCSLPLFNNKMLSEKENMTL